jgi:endonuclease/exonuclease/phosphatase family metal-dependent hydrolase
MTSRVLAVLMGGVVVAGCKPAADGPESFSVASFNVGLAFGYVPEASARVVPITEAIAELDADVVCLQELWLEQDAEGNWTSGTIEAVLGGTASTFEHAYWSRTMAPDGSEPVGCSVEEAEPLEACVVASCGDVPPENLADCVLAECVDEFMGTSAGCQSCMAANLGQPLEAIIAACKGVTQSGIGFDGHNGLAILSRLPLRSTEIRELDYALTARSILHASVELESGGAVEVLCTHLAADLSTSIDYPEGGTYASFGEENRAQTDAILGFAEELGGTVVMAGDFNHGPDRNGARAELPENYAAVLDAGFTDPIAEAGASCTYCDGNALIGGMGESGTLIDHVYVPEGVRVSGAGVVLDERIEVTGADGNAITVNLSDHFGVRVHMSL